MLPKFRVFSIPVYLTVFMIKIYVLCGSGTWSVILREKHMDDLCK